MNDVPGATWLRGFIEQEREHLTAATVQLLNRGSRQANDEVLNSQVEELAHKYYSAVVEVLSDSRSGKFRAALDEIIGSVARQKMPPFISSSATTIRLRRVCPTQFSTLTKRRKN